MIFREGCSGGSARTGGTAGRAGAFMLVVVWHLVLQNNRTSPGSPDFTAALVYALRCPWINSFREQAAGLSGEPAVF